MADIDAPIQMRLAVLLSAGPKVPGMLILYPDKLAHVRTRVVIWWTGLGCAVITALSFALTRSGPGALGALIGAFTGQAIGTAIARRQAPRKVAEGSEGITTIPLDSITGVTGQKAGRFGGWLTVVQTLNGPDCTFRAKPAPWSADLAGALAARGYSVQASPDGLAVHPA
jgi:hypothetical protein